MHIVTALGEGGRRFDGNRFFGGVVMPHSPSKPAVLEAAGVAINDARPLEALVCKVGHHVVAHAA